MSFFITIEGIDGSGKSSVTQKVVERLIKENHDILFTREPGGSVIAEKIRDVILDKQNTNMDARTEALLLAAARRQHLVEKIIPALKANRIVICDRFIDSSLAYQGHARGIGINEVYDLNLFAIDNCLPNLTIFFDITPKFALNRINQDKNREVNRLDLEKESFHELVYEGYLHVIDKYKNRRFKIVDATKSFEEVCQDTYNIIVNAIKEVA